MADTKKKSLSIEVKMYLILVLIFTVVLATSLMVSSTTQKTLITNLIDQQTHEMANSYFDSVNVLMVAGNMKVRQTLRTKMLDKPGIKEARIIRGAPVRKLFGPGFASESAQDKWDKEGLAGQAVTVVHKLNGERLLTVVKPLIASSDHRGTNCLGCHQVSEGTVLGAVRITYSLANIDHKISNHLLLSGSVQAGLFILGLLLTAYFLRQVIIRRIKRLRHAITRIDKESDLTSRISILTNDEIGKVTHAFNGMLGKFQQSLKKVKSTSLQVTDSTNQISHNAEETARVVDEQQRATELMASAVNEMEATAKDIKSNAEFTAEASNEAENEALQGEKITQKVIVSIEDLSTDIGHAATVIKQLNEKTNNVGSFLNVIKGIAEQTNLLALNAAIEAARAGESGRGFAVVADEVRTLATKTQESTMEIESLIAQLQLGAEDAVQVIDNATHAAGKGVSEITEAMQSLQSITRLVVHINELNGKMVSIANDQSLASAEISNTVIKISELASESSDDASETAQISNALLALTHELDTMIAQFRIQ